MMNKSIIELNGKDARKYLLLSSSYCTLNLPDYIDFTPVLSFVKDTVGGKEFSSCLADAKKKPSGFEGVNHHLLVNKDGRYAYRRIHLANPYLYYFIVRMITAPQNWAKIQHHFESRKRPNIIVASLPKVKKVKTQAQAGVDIPAWWEYFEQLSIEKALQFPYVFLTDITDCYGSIYTHAIPWSLYGKPYSKEHRNEKNLGNELDHYMSAMNNDQTNGIPQGSVLFDLIAEIVLAYADSCVHDKLTSMGISDKEYCILRYRDDYRVFSKNRDRLETIVKVLQEVLSELNFRMNTSKTHLSEEVVLDSIKADKLAYISQLPIYSGGKPLLTTIQKELIYDLQFAKEYPNSGTVARLLSTLLNRIGDANLDNENMIVLISITVEIMMSSPRVFNVGTALISFFLSKVEDGKAEIIKDVYTKLRRMTNTGELEIWLQRITYHMEDVDINYGEPLTKVVNGDGGVTIWNNDWVKPALLNDFPLSRICNTEKRDAQTPVIAANEVSIFDYV